VTDEVTLFLSGDVMGGRGVDQVLPSPGDPTLREAYVEDARTYVELAEQVNGPVPAPVDFAWPWGVALDLLDELRPDVRVINLETSITRSDEFAPGKAVNYRMSPGNVPFVNAVRPDVCVLANNHVLDFGRRGLTETLHSLAAAGLPTAGAGEDERAARQACAVPLGQGGRVLVFSVGFGTSGIPRSWAATPDRSGVAYFDEPTSQAADLVVQQVEAARGPGDLVVVSVHWGSNWGYDVGRAERRFAHRLLERGVDVVHGHSSHHPRPIEVHHDRLVLYGCGDLVNDYEGISGHGQFRADLRPLYLATLDRGSGALVRLRVAVLRAWRLSLRPATAEDVTWLASTLDRVSSGLATRVVVDREGWLDVRRG
jgi:poly-gamma-glutamate synthesis protein (capsule biosynthesis protein)